MRLAVKVAARTLWIYSYLTLALILAMCAYPAVLMIRWAWHLDHLGGWVFPEAVQWFVRTYFVALAYMVFGVTMMVVLPVLRILLRWKTGEGTIPIRSFKVWSWYTGFLLLFTPAELVSPTKIERNARGRTWLATTPIFSRSIVPNKRPVLDSLWFLTAPVH